MSRTFKAVIKLGRKAGYSPLGRGQIGRDRMVYVSDPAWQNLKLIAESRGMSRSALIDAIGRGEIVLGDSEPTAPTISGNLMEDESIASILQPTPPTIPIATTPPPPTL